MLELNDLEKDDLKRLGESYTRLMDEFNNAEARSLHAPHGVFAFVHSFFHEVFSGVLEEQAREVAEAMAEATEDVVDEDDEDGAVVINMEPTIMKAFEMMVMVGIELGRQQLGPEKCRCIENVGDSIEEALRDGHCEH
jgi:hypothetical protein